MSRMFAATIVFACLVGFNQAAGAERDDPVFDATTLQTAAELRDTALAGSGAYGLLEDLVATAPSRLPGGPDDLKAVRWTEATFRRLGFDRVWTQPVTLPGWRRISAEARVPGHDDLDLNIVSLGKSASTPKGGVTAPLVHYATLEALEAADPADVAGRIVFISNRMAGDGALGAYSAAVVARARGHSVAAAKGAVALLIRSIGTADSDRAHTGAMSFKSEAGRGMDFEPATNGRAWSLQYGVKTVGAAALSNRDADALVSLLESGNAIELFIDIQNENLGEITTYNIIGEITGSTRPDEIVITGGHIDAWDLGVGAMDDGMGVVVTTSAVGLIAGLPERPARTIRVVAFGAEEVGIHGGRTYADKYGELNHVFGSELDFGLGKVKMLVPNVAEPAIPVLKEVWQLLEPMGIEWFTGFQGFLGADLGPLAAKGLRGATVAVDWSRYFDYHHTVADTLALIEAEDLDFNAAAYAVLLYLVAEHDGRFD